MSRKRLRTSDESICRGMSDVYRLEKAPKPVIKGSKKTTIDDEKVYLTSEPPGKNFRDSILSNRELTQLFAPITSYKIRHYGWNFGGNHKYASQDIQGGGGFDSAGGVNHPDSRRFVMNSGVTNQADTIAWTAGTQAWYETLSLPGTWATENWNGETIVEQQPSMVGLINQSKYGLFNNPFQALFADVNGNEHLDMQICYRGGSQKHTFINQNEHEVFYEIWELTPRDIMDGWIVNEPSAGTNYGTFDNIHSYVSVAYKYSAPYHATTTAESAVNNNGTYSTALTNNHNPAGQRISNKNDVGFRINQNCLDLYHKFRVSKSQRGSIKSGSTLVYNLKHGPFKVKNSVWNRWVIGQKVNSDYNWLDDGEATLYDNKRYGHLIPCATKMMCVRFWSEIGQKGNVGEDVETTGFKMNFKDVSYLQGRIIHTVEDTHSIRSIPYTKTNQKIEKNFMKIDYSSALADNNDWKVINDTQDTNMTSFES